MEGGHNSAHNKQCRFSLAQAHGMRTLVSKWLSCGKGRENSLSPKGSEWDPLPWDKMLEASFRWECENSLGSRIRPQLCCFLATQTHCCL